MQNFINTLTGDYHFFVMTQEYKVRKMNYFQQVDFIQAISSLNEGALSKELVEAQKQIFPLIWAKNGDAWVQLAGDRLDIHLATFCSEFNAKPFDAGLSIFMTCVGWLSENFTSTVEVSKTPDNLNPPQADESGKVNLETPLATILARSLQM